MGIRWPQRRQQNGVTLRPPIKGRIPPINGSTPVALYQWNLLERQKPGIPLIKGIATVAAQTFPAPILIERAGPSTRKKFFEFFNGPDPER